MLEIDKSKTVEVNNIKTINKDDNIVLINKNNRNRISSYYFENTGYKEANQFIKATEKIIRSSDQYSKYISYLSTNQGLINDVLYGNITSEDATLEFHHYPFTLYDIVEIVLNHNINLNKKINTFIIAEEVLDLHFRNLIGVARLSKTAHQMVHAGKIFVPLHSVFGNVNKFVDIYRDGMFNDQIEKFNEIIKFDQKDDYDNSLI